MDQFTCCQVVNKLERAKVIWPYVPLFGSSRASALLRVLSRTKSVRRNSGLYKLGRGKKSVIWYWEFDVEKQYHHQFRTIDYAAALEFYTSNKFMMWKGEDQEKDVGKNSANTAVEASHGIDTRVQRVHIVLPILFSVAVAFGIRIFGRGVNMGLKL